MVHQYDIDRIDNRSPERIRQLAWWAENILTPYHRAEVRGLQHIPAGAALFVGNHNSASYSPDTWIFGAAVFRAHGLEAVPYGLGHELILRTPLLNQVLVPLGGVRASHENAHRIFSAGMKALVYPGGDFDAMRPFRDRNRIVFGGRRGYVRLALRESVPIVPVVAAGAHSTFLIVDDLRWLAELIGAPRWARSKVWPLTVCLPWGMTLGPLIPYFPLPSKILIEVLPPVHFLPSGARAAQNDDHVAACAERLEGTMQRALDRLAAERARLTRWP